MILPKQFNTFYFQVHQTSPLTAPAATTSLSTTTTARTSSRSWSSSTGRVFLGDPEICSTEEFWPPTERSLSSPSTTASEFSVSQYLIHFLVHCWQNGLKLGSSSYSERCVIFLLNLHSLETEERSSGPRTECWQAIFQSCRKNSRIDSTSHQVCYIFSTLSPKNSMHAEFLEKSGCLAVQLELKNGCQMNPLKPFFFYFPYLALTLVCR